MNHERIEELARHERSYWWHVGRRDIIRTFLQDIHLPPSATIVDVGCGPGLNLALLGHYGTVIGVDPNAAARQYASETAGARVLDGSATSLPFPDRSVDLLTCLDVLEHVEDDRAALREFFRVLRPGGTVLLLTPAYQFLWSEHDEALDHVRRYTLSHLHQKFDRAGLLVHRRTYCITTLFLPILVFRFFRSVIRQTGKPQTSYLPLPNALNQLGIGLLRFEAFLLRFVNFPFGVTCAVLARKPT